MKTLTKEGRAGEAGLALLVAAAHSQVDNAGHCRCHQRQSARNRDRRFAWAKVAAGDINGFNGQIVEGEAAGAAEADAGCIRREHAQRATSAANATVRNAARCKCTQKCVAANVEPDIDHAKHVKDAGNGRAAGYHAAVYRAAVKRHAAQVDTGQIGAVGETREIVDCNTGMSRGCGRQDSSRQ